MFHTENKMFYEIKESFSINNDREVSKINLEFVGAKEVFESFIALISLIYKTVNNKNMSEDVSKKLRQMIEVLITKLWDIRHSYEKNSL